MLNFAVIKELSDIVLKSDRYMVLRTSKDCRIALLDHICYNTDWFCWDFKYLDGDIAEISFRRY